MNIPLKDVPVGRFFATAEAPPDNVYILRAAPGWQPGPPAKKGQRRRKLYAQALCQNINTNDYKHLDGNEPVRLIRPDEHDQTTFHI